MSYPNDNVSLSKLKMSRTEFEICFKIAVIMISKLDIFIPCAI